MYLVVNASIRSGSVPESEIRRDLATCFQHVAAAEVISGCIVAQPNGVADTEQLLADLVSMEQAYDPQVDIAVFFVSNGSRWVVTERVPNRPLATSIVGRAPEEL